MKKGIILTIVVLVVLGIVAFFIFNNSSTPSGTQTKTEKSVVSAAEGSSSTVTSGSPRIINVDASRFQFTPEIITVKKGELVKIMINNLDTTHGIMIPDLNVSGIDSVEFTADKAGTYEFRCPTMCGEGHREMKGTLIVQAS